MNPQAAPSQPPSVIPNANTPKMQNAVRYFGQALVGGTYGIIQWDQDNHIRIYDIDPATGSPTHLALDTELSQIQKITSQLTLMTITTGGKKYRMDFSEEAAMWTGTGSIAGAIEGMRLQKKSGIFEWIEAFKSQGVPIKAASNKKVYGIAFAIAGVITVIVIIAVVATQPH